MGDIVSPPSGASFWLPHQGASAREPDRRWVAHTCSGASAGCRADLDAPLSDGSSSWVTTCARVPIAGSKTPPPVSNQAPNWSRAPKAKDRLLVAFEPAADARK